MDYIIFVLCILQVALSLSSIALTVINQTTTICEVLKVHLPTLWPLEIGGEVQDGIDNW